MGQRHPCIQPGTGPPCSGTAFPTDAGGYWGYFGDASTPLQPGCRSNCNGWYSVDLGWYAPARGQAVDVIGPIDGQGFHLNVIGDIPAKARPFVVEPATPRRKFAA